MRNVFVAAGAIFMVMYGGMAAFGILQRKEKARLQKIDPTMMED